jgi:hypothetical protein
MCIIEAAEAAAAEMTGEAGEAVGAGGEGGSEELQVVGMLYEEKRPTTKAKETCRLGGSEELEVVGRSDKSNSTGKSITRLTFLKSLCI